MNSFKINGQEHHGYLLNSHILDDVGEEIEEEKAA